jgi:GNAT superfamily N-acetyltransferase
VVIRPRTKADLVDCERLARDVHRLDGYPPYLPAGDLRAFLLTPDPLGAWVAEEHGDVGGHVALNPRSSDAVMEMASQVLGEPSEQLAVVARLLVDAGFRRRGLGRSLLRVASEDAMTRGLWPILDVATCFGDAIHLYESSGWIRAGQVTVRLPDGSELEEFVYVARRPLTRRVR